MQLGAPPAPFRPGPRQLYITEMHHAQPAAAEVSASMSPVFLPLNHGAQCQHSVPQPVRSMSQGFPPAKIRPEMLTSIRIPIEQGQQAEASARSVSSPPGLELPCKAIRAPPGLDPPSFTGPPPGFGGEKAEPPLQDSAEREVSRGNRRRQKQRQRRKSRQAKGNDGDDDDGGEEDEEDETSLELKEPEKAMQSAQAPSGAAIPKPRTMPIVAQADKESVDLAANLRKVAAKRLGAAWEKLRAEFGVQQLIWNSSPNMLASLAKPSPEMCSAAPVQDMIRAALAAAAAEPKGAVRALEVVCRGEIEGVDCLNNATAAAVKDVIQADRRNTAFQKTACRLEKAGRLPGQCDVGSEVDDGVVEQVESTLQMCDFQDTDLENKVRHSLGLKMMEPRLPEPVPDFDMEPAQVTPGGRPTTAAHFTGMLEGIPSPQVVRSAQHRCRSGNASVRSRSTHSRSSRGSTLSFDSKSTGSSLLSSRSARSQGSRARAGVAPGLPDHSLQTVNEQEEQPLQRQFSAGVASSKKKSCGTPARGLESGSLGTPGLPDLAPWVAAPLLPNTAEAATAVEHVHTLALRDMERSWTKLAEEFNTQVLVWQSCAAFTKSKDVARAENEVKAMMEHALLTNDAVTPGRAFSLAQELQNHPQAGELLSNPTMAAVSAAVEAARVAQMRNKLAVCIARCPAQEDCCPGTDMSEVSLVKLIKDSKLGDLGMEYRIRRVLNLPMGDVLARWKDYRHQRPSGTSV